MRSAVPVMAAGLCLSGPVLLTVAGFTGSAVGVVATAEVTELSDWDDGEQAGVIVGLRISGPERRTFEATWKRSKHPAIRVGLRLPAVVDPADHLFRFPSARSVAGPHFHGGGGT
ncbi:hypothetical protein [Streptomyces canus]|uniref:hypothetical protein n=1 Tax=Streptomyces canus TaxID=58343 RepID=UPI0038092AB9